ncbi:MAG: hypothetical protein B9S32_13835 [Verrucomicrobia bacterium Tous-C9LFEB]|nr:MAG: hypothetical protein B9S32_13835 [Verrucomicrobia bacterium Tous-C9LFEB]
MNSHDRSLLLALATCLLVWILFAPRVRAQESRALQNQPNTFTKTNTFSGPVNMTGNLKYSVPTGTYLLASFTEGAGYTGIGVRLYAAQDGINPHIISNTYSYIVAADGVYPTIRDPKILRVNGAFYMAFTTMFPDPFAVPTYSAKFGMVTSPDGKTWTNITTPDMTSLLDPANHWLWHNGVQQVDDQLYVFTSSADAPTKSWAVPFYPAGASTTFGTPIQITGTFSGNKCHVQSIVKIGSVYHAIGSDYGPGLAIFHATSSSPFSGYNGYSVISTGEGAPLLVTNLDGAPHQTPDGKYQFYVFVLGSALLKSTTDFAAFTTQTVSSYYYSNPVGDYFHNWGATFVDDIDTELFITAAQREVLADKASANAARTLLGTTTQSGALRFSSPDAIINFGTAGTINDGKVNRLRLYDDGDFVYGLTVHSFEFGFCIGAGGTFHFRTGATSITSGTDIATLNSSGDFAPIGNLVLSGTGKGVTFASTSKILSGAGSPESAVTAPVGSLHLRSDGARGSTLYTKESGTGNTGWVAALTVSSGDFSMIAGEDLSAKVGYLVEVRDASGTANAYLPNAITDLTFFVVTSGGSGSGTSVTLRPFDASQPQYAYLKGTCVPGDQLVLADTATSADKGKLRKIPSAAGSYRVIAVALESGSDGQLIRVLPVPVGVVTM